MKYIKTTLSIFLIFTIVFACYGCSNENKRQGENSMNNKEYYINIMKELNDDYSFYKHDLKSADELGLLYNGTLSDEYYFIQAVYLISLNSFINETINMESIQKQFDDSEYSYDCTKDDQIDEFCSFGRENIILRNLPFIERLSNSDINNLMTSVTENKIVPNKKSIAVVENSYKKVLLLQMNRETELKSHDITYTFGEFRGNKRKNNALLFEIKYDNEYDTDYNLNDQRDKLKYKEVENIKNIIISELQESLDVESVVIITN